MQYILITILACATLWLWYKFHTALANVTKDVTKDIELLRLASIETLDIMKNDTKLMRELRKHIDDEISDIREKMVPKPTNVSAMLPDWDAQTEKLSHDESSALARLRGDHWFDEDAVVMSSDIPVIQGSPTVPHHYIQNLSPHGVIFDEITDSYYTCESDPAAVNAKMLRPGNPDYVILDVTKYLTREDYINASNQCIYSNSEFMIECVILPTIERFGKVRLDLTKLLDHPEQMLSGTIGYVVYQLSAGLYRRLNCRSLDEFLGKVSYAGLDDTYASLIWRNLHGE